LAARLSKRVAMSDVFDFSEEALDEIALTTDRPFDEPIKEKDAHMQDLVNLSVEAHGGLERWNQLRQISATFAPGGIGLKQRGQEAFTQTATRVTLDTREQKTIFGPFLAPGQCGTFEPYRTAVETVDGTLLEELKNPRDSFKGMAMGTPWSATQLVYFAGYAMWTYLTVPFSLLRDGIECEEIEPYVEDGETWRALKVTFPKSYVTHSTEQTLYFDDNGLIRRHDYTAEISNDAKAAHYLYDHQNFDGIVFPTRRRVYPRGPDLKPQKDLVVISADLGDFKLSRAAPWSAPYQTSGRSPLRLFGPTKLQLHRRAFLWRDV
jgi:hypothetical protein